MKTEKDNKKGNTPFKKSMAVWLYMLSLLLFLGGIFLFVRDNVLLPDINYVEPPLPTQFSSVSQTSPPSKTAVPESPVQSGAQETPVPTAEVKAIPQKIYFPSQKQSCEIFPGRIDEDTNRMEVIDRADAASWLEYSASPGQPGNSIIAGHKSKDGVAGTFKCLWKMDVGDLVCVELEGLVYKWFEISSISRFEFSKVPKWVMEYDGETRLTLITCIGEWNREANTSSDRLIIVCAPVDPDELAR